MQVQIPENKILPQLLWEPGSTLCCSSRGSMALGFLQAYSSPAKITAGCSPLLQPKPKQPGTCAVPRLGFESQV